MGSIRVIAGSHRGRAIPFTNRLFGNADITTQRVKGAIFSMIGEWLDGSGFLDLFAGSGQIGIEALSRGADQVVFVERDARRSEFIGKCLADMNLASRSTIMTMSSEGAMRLLAKNNNPFDFIFLDPPYDHEGAGERYRTLLDDIDAFGLLAAGGEIIIQHFTKNRIEESIGRLRLMRRKKYGTTSLSVYSR